MKDLTQLGTSINTILASKDTIKTVAVRSVQRAKLLCVVEKDMSRAATKMFAVWKYARRKGFTF